MSLFNQSLLAERGFDRGVFLTITTVTPLVGLAANLPPGWLATRVRLGSLLAAAMLLSRPRRWPRSRMCPRCGEVYAYAAAMGVAGGVLTVVFFTVWRQAFGPAHLGQIQGRGAVAHRARLGRRAARARRPASGPRVVRSVVQYLAVVAAAFALAAWLVPLPNAAVAARRMLPHDRHRIPCHT